MYPGPFADPTPDKPAIRIAETGVTVTHAELDERSTGLTRVLHDAGLRPGDHLAYLSDNTPEVFKIYWAARTLSSSTECTKAITVAQGRGRDSLS